MKAIGGYFELADYEEGSVFPHQDGILLNTGRNALEYILRSIGEVKHIYFVAETKGSLESGQLRGTEAAKIECARQHFQTISTGDIKYDVVTSYSELMNAVMN